VTFGVLLQVTNSLLYDSHHMVKLCSHAAASSSDPRQAASEPQPLQRVLLRRRKLLRWNGEGYSLVKLPPHPPPPLARARCY
jgi:hypothetical protein